MKLVYQSDSATNPETIHIIAMINQETHIHYISALGIQI